MSERNIEAVARFRVLDCAAPDINGNWALPRRAKAAVEAGRFRDGTPCYLMHGPDGEGRKLLVGHWHNAAFDENDLSVKASLYAFLWAPGFGNGAMGVSQHGVWEVENVAEVEGMGRVCFRGDCIAIHSLDLVARPAHVRNTCLAFELTGMTNTQEAAEKYHIVVDVTESSAGTLLSLT